MPALAVYLSIFISKIHLSIGLFIYLYFSWCFSLKLEGISLRSLRCATGRPTSILYLYLSIYQYLIIYLIISIFPSRCCSLKLEEMIPRSLMCPRWRFIHLSLFLKFTYPAIIGLFIYLYFSWCFSLKLEGISLRSLRCSTGRPTSILYLSINQSLIIYLISIFPFIST